MEVAIDSSKRITTGTIYTTATEQGIDNCPHPPIPPNRHQYSLRNSSGHLSEGEVILVFYPGNLNAPRATATFRGRYVAAKLSGVITIQRMDAEAPLDWKIDISITLEPTTVSDTGHQPVTAVVTTREPERSLKQVVGTDGAPMVLIPAGEFWMGSTAEELKEIVAKCNTSRRFDKRIDCKDVFLDEMPRHRVAVNSFLLDKYEVTNELFQVFVIKTGYRTTAEQKGSALTFELGTGWKEIAGASWLKPEVKESVFESHRNLHPVVSVSWEDASAYCHWAEKRLPREAEWEYAARAGTVTQYWWGDRAVGPDDVANLLDDDEEPVRATRGIKVRQWKDGYRQTSPVGALRENPWGLHDMIGNVWEWVDEWYDPAAYSREQSTKPSKPSSGDEKVLRGGSWDNEPFVARVTTRGRDSGDTRSLAVGFRCAQDVPK